MPRVRHPESDEGRLQLFTKTLETVPIDAGANRNYVPAELVAELQLFVFDQPDPQTGDLILGNRTRVTRLIAKRAATSKEVAEANKAEVVLETHIRDFWEVLKRRTFRLGHAVAVLNHYDLPQDGTVPLLTSRADRRLWAQKIADGESAAVAAGFPAMANPSAAEVGQKLVLAINEAAQITPKSREEEEERNAVRAQRPRAIELVEDLIDELRHSTRKLEPGTARDIMRSYGVEFEALEGEKPEPPPAGGGDGTPPPPPTP